MKYYIGDMHLFHKNVTDEGTNFDNRPFKNLEEMHEYVIEYWNNTITNGDEVYIIGDFCWKENEDAISFVSKLKGRKILIIGNHENLSDYRYSKLFDEIVYQKTVKDQIDGRQVSILLSHFPYAFWAKNNCKTSDRNDRKHDIHFYGHVHKSKEEFLYRKFLKELELEGIYCKAYKTVSMMSNMYYIPRTAKEIVESGNNYYEQYK